MLLSAIVGLVSGAAAGRLMSNVGYGYAADSVVGIVGGLIGWALVAYSGPWASDYFGLSRSAAFLFFSFIPILQAVIVSAVLVGIIHVAADHSSKK